MIFRRRTWRGLSLPNLMVSLFIFGLLTSMIVSIMRVQQTQAHASGVRLDTRQRIQILFRNLEQAFEKSSMEGFHGSDDGRSFTLQNISGVTGNGSRAWSSKLKVYHFDTQRRSLLSGEIDLSELGVTFQPALPAALTSDDVEEAVEQLRQQALLKPVADNVTQVSATPTGTMTVEVQVTCVIEDGRFKSEKVDSKRKFFLASTAKI